MVKKEVYYATRCSSRLLGLPGKYAGRSRKGTSAKGKRSTTDAHGYRPGAFPKDSGTGTEASQQHERPRDVATSEYPGACRSNGGAGCPDAPFGRDREKEEIREKDDQRRTSPGEAG